MHQWYVLGPVLNGRWVLMDVESCWIWRLHRVQSIRVSYKFQVFAWLVICQGLPSKTHLAQSGIFDSLFLFLLKVRINEALFMGMFLCEILLGLDSISICEHFVWTFALAGCFVGLF